MVCPYYLAGAPIQPQVDLPSEMQLNIFHASYLIQICEPRDFEKHTQGPMTDPGRHDLSSDIAVAMRAF